MEKTLDANEYIGVHCKHGINRTGFMICYYLCKEKKIDVNLAMETFFAKRGHRFQKKNYEPELKKRFLKSFDFKEWEIIEIN